MKKKTSFWILLFTLLVTAGACDDYTVPVEPKPEGEVNVTLSPDETLMFTAAEGEAEITVLTNRPDSEISIAVKKEERDEDIWCRAELTGNKVKVTVSENLSNKSRATVVTIKVFSVTKTIDVQQESTQTEDPPIEGVYKIAVPDVAVFESTKIYKVMDGDQKVAEICLEYLNNASISSRAVVVYAGKGGAADYENGFVAYIVNADGTVSTQNNNGGKASFNYDDNTLTYEAGTSAAVTTVYLSEEDGITKEEQEGAEDATAEPYFVKDVCDNSYPVVKVGAEVWLGSNLRTTKFGDETEIDVITVDDIPDYRNNIPFAMYSPATGADVDFETFGFWYNAITITGENEALLTQSIVDGNWRVATGGGDNTNGVIGSTTDWQRLFKYVGKDQLGALLAKGYNWKNGGVNGFDITTLSNITGLTIVPAGQRYNITGEGFNLGLDVQAFFMYGNSSGRGYNLAETDAKAPDQAGVREWPHGTDACSIRLVRVDR